MDSAKAYFNEHPFGVTFGVWGTVLGITLMRLAKKQVSLTCLQTGGTTSSSCRLLFRLFRRPVQIPTNVKIIEARIIAQAGLLGGAAAFGLSTYLGGEDKGKRKVATSSWKVRDDFDLPAGKKPAHLEAAAHAEHAAAAPAAAAHAPEIK